MGPIKQERDAAMGSNRWIKRGVLLLLSIVFSGGFCTLLVYSVRTADIRHLEEKCQPVTVASLLNNSISLPIAVGDTGLVAKELALYDGPFAEDGSQDEVFDIAALLVENTTQELVLSAEIKLCTGSEELVFYIEMLPPKAAALVPEQSRQKSQKITFTHCTGWAKKGQELTRKVLIVPSSKGTYRVINNSGNRLTDLVIYHKGRVFPQGIFLGGKAYRTVLSCLEPGQSVEVFPSFFCWGYSDIAAILQE